MSESRYRLSMRTMLLLLTLFSVAVAALAAPTNMLVAIGVLNVTLVVIGVGVVSCFLTQSEQRAFWIAFSLFSSGHLFLTLGPGFDRTVGNALITTKALRVMSSNYVANRRGIDWYDFESPPPAPPSASGTAYVVTGHCVFSLLVGWGAGAFMWVIAPKYQKRATLSEATEETSPVSK